MYFDTDPLDDPAVAIDPDELVRLAVAHTGAQQWNFNQPKSIPLPQRSDDQLYYTGDIKSNERFALQARAYLIQITDPLNFNGEPVSDDLVAGSLYIDWVCKFQLPQLNPAGIATRDTLLINVAVPTTTNVEEITVTGLEPMKRYTAAMQAMQATVPAGETIRYQPKIQVREQYTQGTNAFRTPGQQTGSSLGSAVVSADERGRATFWAESTVAGLSGTVPVEFRPVG